MASPDSAIDERLKRTLTQLDSAESVIRYGHRYCLAILDLDYFKSYNDAYGHLAGDHILQSLRARVQTTSTLR